MTPSNTPSIDHFQVALARYVKSVSTELADASVTRATKAAILDALAVSLGALSHPAAIAGRKYARNFSVSAGARVWGSGEMVNVEAATLVNGVPLRAYDFNDLYIGTKGGGHPSDMIPALIALAEWKNLSGQKLLEAVALGYEVAMLLCDAIDLESSGWDYPNVIAIGAACAASHLLGLSELQVQEALAICVTPHMATNEVESSELDAKQGLTMWKRFNGSDSMRQAIYACLLAEVGVEGVVRPFEGKDGFFAKVEARPDDLQKIIEVLSAKPSLSCITRVTYKRWPVGSRGQSAIQAALDARRQAGGPDNIESVSVLCDEQVHHHLFAIRSDPFNPVSRETADHSLPYIVAAAVLDGYVGTDSFDVQTVTQADRLAFVQEKVSVAMSPELSSGAAGGFLAQVLITGKDGQAYLGKASAPPGHAKNRFEDTDHDKKFMENVGKFYPEATVAAMLSMIWELDKLDRVGRLVDLTVLPAASNFA